jgi:hypothetical protein
MAPRQPQEGFLTRSYGPGPTFSPAPPSSPADELDIEDDFLLDDFDITSQQLLFWSKSAVMAYVTSGTDLYVWTQYLPTNDFNEIITQLVVDAEIAPNSTITVTLRWKRATSN